MSTETSEVSTKQAGGTFFAVLAFVASGIVTLNIALEYEWYPISQQSREFLAWGIESTLALAVDAVALYGPALVMAIIAYAAGRQIDSYVRNEYPEFVEEEQ